MNKILWVKFAWSDYYRGDLVDGNFGWLNENRDKNGGRGHEAFNFQPAADGTYHCYVPPQAGEHAPYHEDPHGWTVICLAKHPKYKGIHIAGWYEDATLLGEWRAPPVDLIVKRGDASHPAYDWSYCIASKTAYFVPPWLRTDPFSDTSVKQGKYSFLEGPGVKSTEGKHRVLEKIQSRIRALSAVAIKNPNEINAPDPGLDVIDPLKGFGTPEHRKDVELAAEAAVIEYYEAQGFKNQRVTHLPCGYDFIFSNGNATFHVEVKGTSGAAPRFFLTRNEYAKGKIANPAWRLAMVTSALTGAPTVQIYDAIALDVAFNLDPYIYLGGFIPHPT